MTELATEAQAPEGTTEAPPVEVSDIAASMQQVLDRKNSLKQREAQQANVKGMEDEYNQLLYLADNQPLEFLKRRGHTLDQLSNMDDGQSSVVDQMVAKIETLSERLERQDAERAQQTEAAQEAATLAKMENFVKTQATAYPLVAAAGGAKLVIERMRNAYNNDSKVISESQAAAAVQSDLEAFMEQCAPAAGYVKGPSNADEANSEAPQRTLNSGHQAGTVPANLDELVGNDKLQALLRKHNV